MSKWHEHALKGSIKCWLAQALALSISENPSGWADPELLILIVVKAKQGSQWQTRAAAAALGLGGGQ